MLKPAINWTKVFDFFSFSAIKKTSLVFSSSQAAKADAGADTDPEPGTSCHGQEGQAYFRKRETRLLNALNVIPRLRIDTDRFAFVDEQRNVHFCTALNGH